MDGEVDMDGDADGLVPGQEMGLLAIFLLGRGQGGAMDLVLAGDFSATQDMVTVHIIHITAEEDIIRSIRIHIDMITLQNISGK